MDREILLSLDSYVARSKKIYDIELDSQKYTTDIEFGKGSRNFCKESFAGLLLSFACMQTKTLSAFSKHQTFKSKLQQSLYTTSMLKSVFDRTGLELEALSLVDSDLLLGLTARLSEDKCGLRLVLRLVLRLKPRPFKHSFSTSNFTTQYSSQLFFQNIGSLKQNN